MKAVFPLSLFLMTLTGLASANSVTETIGFRGKKGFTGLIKFEYDSSYHAFQAGMSYNHEEGDGGTDWASAGLRSISVQFWRPDGSSVFTDGHGNGRFFDAYRDGQAGYSYLDFQYDNLKSGAPFSRLDVGSDNFVQDTINGWTPPYYLSSYGSKYFGTLANDAFQDQPELGFVVDRGRLMVGGIPTHTPDHLPVLAGFGLTLAALAWAARRREA